MAEVRDALKVAKNTLFLNISTVLTRGISFITSVALARHLDKEGFGRYTFALYFTGLFVVLSELGLNYLTIREVAKDKSAAAKYLGHNIAIRATLGLVTILLIFLIVNVMHYPPAVKLLVYIFAFYTIGKSFAGSFDSIFFSFEHMEFVSILNVFLTSLILGGIIAGIYLKFSLVKLALAYPAATAAYICLSAFLISKRFIKPDFNLDYRFAAGLIKDSVPFILSGIFLSISSRIDMVMLQKMQGDAATGYYGVSRTFMSILIFIPANFITVLYPVFSRLYKSSRESLGKYYEKSTLLLLVLALPVALLGTMLSDKIIIFFYGRQYLPAAISLQILVWALVIQFAGSGLDILMLASDRQKTVARVAFWLMLLNVALNFILIRKFSFVGASITTLVTNLVASVIFFVIIYRNVYRLNLLRLFARPLVATLAAGIFIYSFRESNMALVICCSSLIYILLLFCLRVISKSDIDLVKELFKTRLFGSWQL